MLQFHEIFYEITTYEDGKVSHFCTKTKIMYCHPWWCSMSKIGISTATKNKNDEENLSSNFNFENFIVMEVHTRKDHIDAIKTEEEEMFELN